MNKLKAMIALLALGLSTSSAVYAQDGRLAFSGKIVNGTCTITEVVGGEAALTGTVSVNLGTVLVSNIGHPGMNYHDRVALNFTIDCTGLSDGLEKVGMRLDAAGGSGIDETDNRLLKVTGEAVGVAIAVYNKGNELMNLNNNPTIDGEYIPGTDSGVGTSKISLMVGYAKNGYSGLKVGTANGNLPFTLVYN